MARPRYGPGVGDRCHTSRRPQGADPQQAWQSGGMSVQT